MNCRLSLPYLVIAGAESCVLFYCCGFCLNFVYRTWWFQRTCSPGVRQCRYILNSFIVLFPVGQCEIVYYCVVISTVAWFCSDRPGTCCRVQWVWFCVVQCVGACMYVGALCHAPVVLWLAWSISIAIRVLSDLGLFKRWLQYVRCHLCEERPGSDSGKSCFLLLSIIIMTLC